MRRRLWGRGLLNGRGKCYRCKPRHRGEARTPTPPLCDHHCAVQPTAVRAPGLVTFATHLDLETLGVSPSTVLTNGSFPSSFFLPGLTTAAALSTSNATEIPPWRAARCVLPPLQGSPGAQSGRSPRLQGDVLIRVRRMSSRVGSHRI